MTAGEYLLDDEHDPYFDEPAQEQKSQLVGFAQKLFDKKPGDIYFSKSVQFGSDTACTLTQTQEALLIGGTLLELTTEQAFDIHARQGVFDGPKSEERARYHRDNNGYTGLNINTPTYGADIKLYRDGRARMDANDKKLGISSRNSEVREGYLGAAIFCVQIMGLPNTPDSSINLVDWVVDEFRQPGHHINHGDDFQTAKDVFAAASDVTKDQFMASVRQLIDKEKGSVRFIQKASLELPDGQLLVKRSYPVQDIDQGDPRIEVEYQHAASPGSQFDFVEGYLSCGGDQGEVSYEVGIYDLNLMAAKIKALREAALDPSELAEVYQNNADRAKAMLRSNQTTRETIREDVRLGYWGLCQGGLSKVISLLETAK